MLFTSARDFLLPVTHTDFRSPSLRTFTPKNLLTMANSTGQGLWSNSIVPHLYSSGAMGSDMAAGKKTLQRLRWLFLVVQLGDGDTQQHGVDLGNDILTHEDFEGESESDDDRDLSKPTSISTRSMT